MTILIKSPWSLFILFTVPLLIAIVVPRIVIAVTSLCDRMWRLMKLLRHTTSDDVMMVMMLLMVLMLMDRLVDVDVACVMWVAVMTAIGFFRLSVVIRCLMSNKPCRLCTGEPPVAKIESWRSHQTDHVLDRTFELLSSNINRCERLATTGHCPECPTDNGDRVEDRPKRLDWKINRKLNALKERGILC